MIKGTVIILFVLLGIFQYQAWRGHGGIPDTLRLKKLVATQQAELDTLNHRNHLLEAEINFLKENPLALEERARSELGMIKQGETFYLVIEPMR